LPSPPPRPPSGGTAGDTDMPINDAPLPTPRAPFVRFTILVWRTDVRIPPAPGAGTISQSRPVVRPRPPCCCNCGNDHTATFRECPARPPPSVPSRTSFPAPAPTGQDPMDLAVDGGPAPTTPPTGKGPLEVDLVTPRQPPPAGPSTRPGTTHGFGGPLPLEEPSPSPAPFTRRVRPGNE